MIERVLEALVSLKPHLKPKPKLTIEEEICIPQGMSLPEEEDDEPLTWAEQKGIRAELRRFQLWHALRRKVPRGFEEFE